MDPQSEEESRNQPQTTDEVNTEESAQRKRSRVGSRLDENIGDEPTNELAGEATSVSSETDHESADHATTVNPTGPVKRRKLNVDGKEARDQKERTTDSIRTITTTHSESKNESSATASTTTDDDDDDDEDDDDDDNDDIEEDEDDEVLNEKDQDGTTIEEANLPSTTNRYLRLRQRELGIFHQSRKHTTCRAFHDNIIASRNIVQRMKVSQTLDAHDGCVNALAFNQIGTWLASASDDLRVILWDWASNQAAAVYDSGHHSNVFQAKFLPHSDDYKVVSCARDGQVRLAELHPSGTLKCTKKIAQHHQSAHKLSVDTVTGTDVFSCGEDGLVFHIDIRESRANKLLTVNSDTINKLPLYSIELNRTNQNEFIVAGMDPHIRVFDRRYIDAQNTKPLKSFCPDLVKKIEDRRSQPSVTCAVYNHNGTEILGSYNDEDIYLFDAAHSDGADAIHRYYGHRNNNTVKGVNFYGRNSEYIISGSDCGHIFIWDKTSEKCIWYAKGDDDGTVNVLEPHPHFPIIATSGLEHTVKIWEPISQEAVDYKRLKLIMKRNARDRERELHFASVLDTDAGGFLRLIRPVFRRMPRRPNVDDEHTDEEDDDGEDEDEEDDDDEGGASRRARHTYSLDCAPS